MKQAQRGKFDVVMAWAIDRIGRSLVDLLNTIETLKACSVDLYLDQQSTDTTSPSGKPMLQIDWRVRGARACDDPGGHSCRATRAKANGKKLGRPLNDPDAIELARAELGKGLGINRVAKLVGLSNGTVARLKAEIESPRERNRWLDQRVTTLRQQRDAALVGT